MVGLPFKTSKTCVLAISSAVDMCLHNPLENRKETTNKNAKVIITVLQAIHSEIRQSQAVCEARGMSHFRETIHPGIIPYRYKCEYAYGPIRSAAPTSTPPCKLHCQIPVKSPVVVNRESSNLVYSGCFHRTSLHFHVEGYPSSTHRIEKEVVFMYPSRASSRSCIRLQILCCDPSPLEHRCNTGLDILLYHLGIPTRSRFYETKETLLRRQLIRCVEAYHNH